LALHDLVVAVMVTVALLLMVVAVSRILARRAAFLLEAFDQEGMGASALFCRQNLEIMQQHHGFGEICQSYPDSLYPCHI
jgi:hypothetical protein